MIANTAPRCLETRGRRANDNDTRTRNQYQKTGTIFFGQFFVPDETGSKISGGMWKVKCVMLVQNACYWLTQKTTGPRLFHILPRDIAIHCGFHAELSNQTNFHCDICFKCTMLTELYIN